MPWVKRGMIFSISGQNGWMRSHAQVPTALVMKDRLRVYIAVRPEQRSSATTFVDLALDDPGRILYFHPDPILPLGPPGTYDEFGVMPSAVFEIDGRVILYITGWTRGQTVPYLNAVGIAISEDGGKTFRRMFPGPVMDRTRDEPFSAMSPSIVRKDGTWHAWYGSGVEWTRVSGKVEPVYYIKYAHSKDGIEWVRPNITCIPGRAAGEATTRPSVIWDKDRFRMWFSYRASTDFRGGAGSYRMGYAESVDGTIWERDDSRAGIEASATGWDSEMVCYPNIVDTPIGRVMFYNGNGFGAHGFGYAVWQD